MGRGSIHRKRLLPTFVVFKEVYVCITKSLPKSFFCCLIVAVVLVQFSLQRGWGRAAVAAESAQLLREPGRIWQKEEVWANRG